MNAPRWIAHLDMDAFYASVELLRYPELVGQPVVVGGREHPVEVDGEGRRRFARLVDYVGRGVVTTCTYAARALGVHSGMGLMKAAQLAPQAVLLPVDFDQYRQYSKRFKAAVAQLAPVIEDRGIDEIYMDLTAQVDAAAPDVLTQLRTLGMAIKAQVLAETRLTCSIGITPNKLLSKLCSDLEKPDGLTLLTLADIPARIWPLPVRRINGVGPKTEARLNALGIHRIGDLAAADVRQLVEHFGENTGRWLHRAAQGEDARPVVTCSEPKSLSRETTFERDLHPQRDRARLSAIFTELCERLAHDLARRGYVARAVGVKLRYDDFSIVTRECSLEHATQDARLIRRHAGLCLKKNVPLERRLRLLGVRAGRLEKCGAASEGAKESGGQRP